MACLYLYSLLKTNSIRRIGRTYFGTFVREYNIMLTHCGCHQGAQLSLVNEIVAIRVVNLEWHCVWNKIALEKYGNDGWKANDNK
jgi:hypothetical protein